MRSSMIALFGVFLACLIHTCFGLYNESRAVEYAKIASAAGCEASSLESWSCGWKCSSNITSVKVCPGHIIKSFIGVWETKCIMSFEGTHDVFSVLDDLVAARADADFPGCDGCRVHAGFLQAYKSLKPCIISALTENGCKRRGIGSTGWSLGAAASTLAMVDLAAEGWIFDESYDFGKPRIGNAEFASRFNSLFGKISWRITHRKDPIPHVPPYQVGPLHLGFVHVEPEAFYDGPVGQGHAECAFAGDRNCSERYDNLAVDILHAFDHFYQMDVRMGKSGCGHASPDSVKNNIVFA